MSGNSRKIKCFTMAWNIDDDVSISKQHSCLETKKAKEEEEEEGGEEEEEEEGEEGGVGENLKEHGWRRQCTTSVLFEQIIYSRWIAFVVYICI